MCSRTPVTRTLKGDEKEFEFTGNSNYQGKFQRNFDQGKGNLVRVSGEFELSEFELSRFYCILLFLSGCALFFSQLFPCLLQFCIKSTRKIVVVVVVVVFSAPSGDLFHFKLTAISYSQLTAL